MSQFRSEIQNYLDRVKRTNAEGTWKVRKRDLKKYDQWLDNLDLDLPEVGKEEIDTFLLEQGDEYASATVESVYYSVSKLHEYLERFKDLDDPTEDLQRAEYKGNGNGKTDEIVYLEKEEIEAMCEAVEGPNALRDELLIRMLFQTGMRRSEVINVKLDGIDREARTIEFYSPKADENHTVSWRPGPIDLLLDQWIDRGYRDAKKPSDYLFPTEESEQLSGTHLGRIVKDAAEAAGVQETLYTDAKGDDRVKVGVHTLRHSHAVNALKQDVPITAVRDQLNHSDISMTQKYQRLTNQDVQDAYDRHWE